jgi:AAA domain
VSEEGVTRLLSGRDPVTGPMRSQGSTWRFRAPKSVSVLFGICEPDVVREIIEATTIARLRNALEEGVVLAPRSVLIVEEAGMVGTRDLAALADAAGRGRDQAGSCGGSLVRRRRRQA